jgi:FADH2 O2-dependent halogenase
MAMVARRLGLSVVLLERGSHPRIVVGESSTPLSNLLLEEIALRYNLPRLLPLTKWGSWQQHYPEIACGLKRGFTFHYHASDQTREVNSHGPDQLLVAASPHDAIADTHWYRAHVDAFLVEEARSLGTDYLDHVHLEKVLLGGECHLLRGVRDGRTVSYQARFLLDATGPRGFLHKALRLTEAPVPKELQTQSLYNHFTGVERLEHTPYARTESVPPYPIDDAAMHHLFPGGWVWVLRFNNGVTSAGVVATDAVAEELGLREGSGASWERLLARIPALREQFKTAQPLGRFTYIPRVPFRGETLVGERWAMLPSAAGFIDPMLSTGFPLTLLGISRLANIFSENWDKPSFASSLENYARQTQSELVATERLISSLYSATTHFSCFAALSLLYFAAASYSETARRLNKETLAPSFLLHDHPAFGPACRRLYNQAVQVKTEADAARFRLELSRAIEPFDLAGLTADTSNNWYPVRASDLLSNAHKLGATAHDIHTMLDRCGFSSASATARPIKSEQL